MRNASFASPSQIEALGRSLLAVRVKGGRVPQGCQGFSLEGEENIKRFKPGDEIEAPPLGKLWWIYPDALEVRFAPDVRAPEAGVALRVIADNLDATDSRDLRLIADWLDKLGPAIGADELRDELRGHVLLQLPPCVQRDELQKRTIGLSQALMQRGLRCTEMARVDLYPAVDGHALSQKDEQPAASEPRICAGDAVPLDTGRPAACPPVPPTQSDLKQAIALDARFERRLFHELGPLASRLRDLPWPDDTLAFDLRRALLRRMEHLAATTGRLPTLENRINPTRILPERIRLLVAESRLAAQGLDEAWSLLGTGTDSLDEAPDLDALDRIVTGIEIAIARRRTPYWEEMA